MQRISYRPSECGIYQSRRMINDKFHNGIRKQQRERMKWDMRKRLYEQHSTSSSHSQSFRQDRNSQNNIYVIHQRRANSQVLDNRTSQNGINKITNQIQIKRNSTQDSPKRSTGHIIQQENKFPRTMQDARNSQPLINIHSQMGSQIQSPTSNHNSPQFTLQSHTQNTIKNQLQNINCQQLSTQNHQVGLFVPVHEVQFIPNQAPHSQKISQETLSLNQHVNPQEFSFKKQEDQNYRDGTNYSEILYNSPQRNHPIHIQPFNIIQEQWNQHPHPQQNYIAPTNPLFNYTPPPPIHQVPNEIDYFNKMQFINHQIGFKYNSPDLTYQNFGINRSPTELQNIPMEVSSPVYFDQQFYLLRNGPSPPVPHRAQMINNFMEIQEPQKVYSLPKIEQKNQIKPIQKRVRQIYKIQKPSKNVEKPILKPSKAIQKVEENSINQLFKRKKQQKTKVPQKKQERKAAQVINFSQRQKKDEQTKRESNEWSIIKRHLHYVIYSKVLGKGSYGSVYEGMNTITGQKVAVKKISFRKINQLAQIDCLKEIKHQNIMTLYDYYYEAGSKQLYLFLEYCGLNLRQKLESLQEERKEVLELIQVKVNFIEQLIMGMNKLNQKGYIHRDLKFQNILVKNDSIIKICDFGLCRKLNNKLQVDSVRCGTPYTMAPQIYFHPKQDKQNPIYTEKSDIFSLAVIIYEILYDIHPFDYMEDRLKKFDIYKRQETKEKFKIFSKLTEKTQMNIDWIEEIIEGGLKKVDARITWEELITIFKKRNDLQPKDQIKRNFLKKTKKFEQAPSQNKNNFEQEKPKLSKIIQLPNLNAQKSYKINKENKQCNPEQYSGKKEQSSNRMIKQNEMFDKNKDIPHLDLIKIREPKSQTKRNSFKDFKELRKPYKNEDKLQAVINDVVENKKEQKIVERVSVRAMVLEEQKAGLQMIFSRKFFMVLLLISIILLATNVLFVDFSRSKQLIGAQRSSIY